MGYDLFLNKQPEKKKAVYDLVGGSFQCVHCHVNSDEARYYPTQRLLSWDCDECKQVNNIEGFSLD